MKYLIVGLGNIGVEYAHTRHNIGFDVVDELARQTSGQFDFKRLAYFAELSFKGRKLFTIKPSTYMNLSGNAVNHWMRELKIERENILVIVDDLALPFGKLRLKLQGGSAGHNGLKSIEVVCGGQNYARLRFGIGDDFPKERQVDYVLSPFDKDEEAVLPELIATSVELIKSFVTAGAMLTMTNFNK